MCKDCIVDHLSKAISATSIQLSQPNQNGLVFHLTEVNLCRKIAKPQKYKGIRTFHFPGKSTEQARVFTIILRLSTMILQNVMEDRFATSRDLYYRDVQLFGNQQTVVRNLNRLVRILEVPRSLLNIVASPNGLVCGSLTIAMESEEIITTSEQNGASLIPVGDISYVSTDTPPRFILVVEKEAVFTHLQTELRNGIIITGKGFPDRATRNLLRALALSYPQVPVYGLVDSDPHGILILRSYETGSMYTYEPEFKLNMKFLGVSLLEYTDGLVPLTINDMKVAMSTLKKDWIYTKKYEESKIELQRGLFMGLKGEMNLLDVNQSERLSSYVKNKMRQMQKEELFIDSDDDNFDETLVDLTQTVGYETRSNKRNRTLL